LDPEQYSQVRGSEMVHELPQVLPRLSST
jgi:hypothetical protein